MPSIRHNPNNLPHRKTASSSIFPLQASDSDHLVTENARCDNAEKEFSSRKKGKSDSDVPLLDRLRASSAWSVFDFWCEGTASPKDSEAVARQRFSQQKILHGVAPGRHNQTWSTKITIPVMLSFEPPSVAAWTISSAVF